MNCEGFNRGRTRGFGSGGAGIISTSSWMATGFGDGGLTGTATGVGCKKKSRARFLRGGDLFGESKSEG